MFAAIVFVVGMILIALNFTFVPDTNWILLIGIILSAVGVAFSKIFSEF